MKRVIGLPGDEVEVRADGTTLVNGAPGDGSGTGEAFVDTLTEPRVARLLSELDGDVVVASSMLSLVAFGALLLIPMSTTKNAIGDAPAQQAS